MRKTLFAVLPVSIRKRQSDKWAGPECARERTEYKEASAIRSPLQHEHPEPSTMLTLRILGICCITAGLSVPVNSQLSINEPKKKCPKYLDSVTAVNDHTWFLFKDYNVYKIYNGKITGDVMRIRELFQDGPDFVNATVTSNDLTLLFAERIIYGYQYDGQSFSPAPGFPRELHERVLFYPQAAFPLNNGSVVLLSGNVFATYVVSDNVPSILNDKTRFFPNIPEEVRSGIPKIFHDFSEYYMFDENTVSDWNAITKQVASVQPITEFFKCA